MIEKKPIETIKDDIVKIVTDWYSNDCQLSDEDIYRGLNPGKRNNKITDKGEMLNYVDQRLNHNPTLMVQPGAVFYESLIVNDFINVMPERWLRRFLVKLQAINFESSFMELAPICRDLARSMRDSYRRKKEDDFQKRYRPELIQLHFQENYFRRRPLAFVTASRDSASPWSPIPAKLLIDYQLAVANMVEDTEGYGYIHNSPMDEEIRLARMAEIEALGMLIGNCALMSATARVSDTVMIDLGGHKQPEQSYYLGSRAIDAAISIIRESTAKIDAIHASGTVTPYTHLYKRYHRLCARVENFTGAEKKRFVGLLFDIHQRAIIFHDLALVIESYNHLYGVNGVTR